MLGLWEPSWAYLEAKHVSWETAAGVKMTIQVDASQRHHRTENQGTGVVPLEVT